MAQIFHRRSNTIARASLVGAVMFAGAAGWALHTIYWSPYLTEVRVPKEQFMPFSHKHHVAGMGIDCRYCHASVETAASAGIPPTETCMTCHSQLWTNAAVLAPVRQSWATNTRLSWNRVHDLPDFVFFNHSIHIHKGIGCSTCHGRVDQMPLMWKEHTLYMKWCLECHREPERFIRPREEVFNIRWTAPPDQIEQGRQLTEKYQVNTRQLTDCSMCHR
jgi:hypothetical protein